MSIAIPAGDRRAPSWRVAAVFAVPAALGASLLPFLSFRPNRIVSGEGILLWRPGTVGAEPLGWAALIGLAALTLLPLPQAARLALALAGAALTVALAGQGANALMAEAPDFARVSLGGGFWVALAFLALAAADAAARLALAPLVRIGLLAGVFGAAALALGSGALDRLSILQEYDANADAFDAAFAGHLKLVLGSLVPALLIGLPLGRLCHASPRARAVAVPVLNLLQTTPSIAMFGLLMVPLGALAAAWPGLRDLGVAGIGAAPAIVALTLYSLLPIVANTMAGFAAVPAHLREAGRGMGMGRRRLLWQVEAPLAAPVILTGIRIVVVQNIGLAAVAALIGGGGFGTLVFRGMGQTAMDLVLLGTLPIVAMAIAATVLFDAAIDSLNRGGPR
ncbi:ABC transporter permease [Limimaricola pyoseonensis]|uniref:Osmoprotectant transport system permease protein n=1 Tax=Limimaricola pyoseonensis TaxID=521013 RepID=A0A1G7KFK1_9RHOB|nr:ABC transporter permease [Limimaricola pyoseonensis]SDF35784.1 osmoprotectant transport system permease protein [Limimaricola pyoseonensis]